MRYFLLIFFLFNWISFSQTYLISGKVTDEEGKPLLGVNVLIPNTGLGDATNEKGEYEISGLKKGSLTIEFSSIGYRKVQRQFTVSNADINLDIILPEEIVESEQIIITAGKHEQFLSELPVSAAIISSDKLLQKNFFNLEDALKYVPGVNMVQDQISIRGSSGYSRGAGSRVLLAIDGIPYYTGDTGETIWEAIPTHALQRVELIKGAASSLYGSTALGGVINVLTRPISNKPITYVKTYLGVYDSPSHDEWKWSDNIRFFNGQTISHSRTFNKLGIAASITRVEDMGYYQSGFSHKYIGYLKSSYSINSTTSVTLLANTLNKKSGNFVYWKDSRNALVPPAEDQGETVETARYMLGSIFKSNYNNKLFYEIKASYYHTFWDDGAVPVNNESATDLFRGELQTTLSLYDNMIIVSGTEASVSSTGSNLFGDRNAYSVGLYSHMDYDFKIPLNLSAGLRYDYNKLDHLGPSNAVSPKVGVNYKFNEKIIGRFFIGTGFRAPSLAEAFTSTTASGITVKPNSNLEPERSISFELGGDYIYNENIKINGALFQSEYYNFIEPGIDPNDGLVIFDNLTRARIQGIELNAETYFLKKSLHASAGYTFLYAKDIERNKFLKYRPRHSAAVSIEYNFKEYEVGADFRFWSRVEEIDEELIALGIVPDGEKRVDVYVVDLRGAYDLKKFNLPLKVFLNIKNLFNYNYVELIGNLEPIRNYSLSLELIL